MTRLSVLAIVVMELGFTRSFVYDLSSVSFNIGINLGQLYRRSQK
jgi:hypothetical protein